jgi:hypothetical protein
MLSHRSVAKSPIGSWECARRLTDAHPPSCCPDKDGYPVTASDIRAASWSPNPDGFVDEINS